LFAIYVIALFILFFFFVGILHLICNWGWVRANIFKRRKRQ